MIGDDDWTVWKLRGEESGPTEYLPGLLLDYDAGMAFSSAVREDDVPEFVKMMGLMFNHTTKPKLCPDYIMQLICYLGALNCATALLGGLPGVSVDLNIRLDDGAYPLHLAAEGSYWGLVDLFLRNGARTDVALLENGSPNNSLPLNVALESLHHHSYLVDWTCKESIYNLVTKLCLPQMRSMLETNRLLAQSTEKVDEIFKYYAIEGQLIEMAALLMVAKEKIMAQTHGFMTIRERIQHEIFSVGGGSFNFGGPVNFALANCQSMWVQLCEAKREALISAFPLLRLFETAGDALGQYLRSQKSNVTTEMVVKDVETILKKAGTELTDKDIDLSYIDCESLDSEDSKVVEARGSLGTVRSYESLGECFQLEAETVWSHMQKQMPRRVPFMLAHKMIKPPVTSCRAFHSDVSGHFLRPSASSKSIIKARSNGEMNAIQRPLGPFGSRNPLAFLASLIKRGMRHV